MVRALAAAALSLVLSLAAAAQDTAVLHIKVSLTGAGNTATPVPRHTLLISDNPTTAPPRTVVTGADGTADARLRPGTYTVESDQPVVFDGKAYQWTQMLDIVAGHDVVLELTSANAEFVDAAASPPPAARERELDLAVLKGWEDGVVALWTPTAHASGFLVDAAGLIATNQRVVGTATLVEAQLTPTIKVAASVVVADAARDVAVVRIDPGAAASLRPVSLRCEEPAAIRRSGQELVAIGVPLRQSKGPAFGAVDRVDAHSILTDFILPAGSSGGPVFTVDGAIVGLTSIDEEKADERRQNSRVVNIADVCAVVAAAQKKMTAVAAPSGAHLPVEPATTVPEAGPKETAQRRTRDLARYQISSSDFDVTFITPALIRQGQSSHASQSGRSVTPQGLDPSFLLAEFGNWSDYVGDRPPVLLVRVTPKLVESIWMKLGRGAAQTQGVALPPLKRPKSGFERLRAFCGETEAIPIHPFKLEHRVTETNVIDEGLYVFDPAALGPSCGAVKLEIYSHKEPAKGDVRVVDQKILEQVWSDFASDR